MGNRTCSISDCGRQHEARGWCAMHYERWKRHGDPHHVSPRQVLRGSGIEVRFLAKVDRLPNGCWQWAATSNARGYGLFKAGGVNAFAHRWAYGHWVGSIPPGLHIDHFKFPQDGCIGPACVNPEHLRPASPRENALRGDTCASLNVAKTHCPQGHPYSGENLRIKRSGSRICRTCDRRAMLTRYHRRQAQLHSAPPVGRSRCPETPSSPAAAQRSLRA